jgi:asparagine synthase (glutamine-hydrolysing)
MKAYLHALLHVEDRTSMAVSLESRVPLCCDHSLLELVATVPERVKIDGFEPKYLLRKAANGKIPNRILRRRDKRGFPTPIGIWLRKQIEHVEQILLSEKAASRGVFDTSQVRRLIQEHESGRHDHGMTLFMLLSVEFWFKRFVDA